MIEVTGTTDWKETHPGAVIGLLELSGVKNDTPCELLNQRKRGIEAQLRSKYAGFSRKDFLALPVMSAYDRYYKHFDKTYHVQLQIESIVLKSRNLPEVSPLVDANFSAEVETLVLAAGHDADKLTEPVCIDLSRSGDEISALNGETKPIRAGDMVMRDKHGVCCSILYGQDNLSPITAATTHVLYVIYAPAGVPVKAVEDHFERIEQAVRLCSPQLVIEQKQLLKA